MKDIAFIRISLLAIIFNIGLVRSCDQEAAQACATQLQSSLTGPGADTDRLRTFCNMRDSMIDSVLECFASHLSSCDEAVRNLYTQQIELARQAIESHCAALDNMPDSPRPACETNLAEACMKELQSGADNIGEDMQKLGQFCATKDELLSSTESCISNALQTCDEATQNIFSQMIEGARKSLDTTCATIENLPESAICVLQFYTQCTATTPQLRGMNDLFSADQQGGDSQHQDQICSTMQEKNYTELKQCVRDLGCADVDITAGMGSITQSSLPVDMVGSTVMPSYSSDSMPSITFTEYIYLIAGICTPECRKFQESFGAAQNCVSSAGSAELDCMEIKTQFDCVRDTIGDCDALRDFMEMMLEQSQSELEKYKSQCPDLNLALRADSKEDGDTGGAAAIVMGPVLSLIPALVFLYRHISL